MAHHEHGRVDPLDTDSAAERRSRRAYGCSFAEALQLNDGLPLPHPRGKAKAYVSQHSAALRRRIGWEISFPEWASLWADSGRWCQRGPGIGQFCMARNGDVGPYRLGNVSIQLSTLNSASRLGKGRGWTFVPGARNPYQVNAQNQHVGCFASQEQAEAAYRQAVGVVHG